MFWRPMESHSLDTQITLRILMFLSGNSWILGVSTQDTWSLTQEILGYSESSLRKFLDTQSLHSGESWILQCLCSGSSWILNNLYSGNAWILTQDTQVSAQEILVYLASLSHLALFRCNLPPSHSFPLLALCVI